MVVQQTHPKREDSNRVKVIVSPVGRQGRPGTPGVSIRFFDTLQEALDLQPRPENGVTFQVREETDPENFGFYVFDDREPEGYRYLGERWDDEYLTQIENRIDAFEQSVTDQVQGLDTRVEDVETDVEGFKTEVEDRVEDVEDAFQSLQDTTARYAFDTLQEAQDKWASFSQEEKDNLDGKEFTIATGADAGINKWDSTQTNGVSFVKPFLQTKNIVNPSYTQIKTDTPDTFKIGDYAFIDLPEGSHSLSIGKSITLSERSIVKLVKADENEWDVLDSTTDLTNGLQRIDRKIGADAVKTITGAYRLNNNPLQGLTELSVYGKFVFHQKGGSQSFMSYSDSLSNSGFTFQTLGDDIRLAIGNGSTSTNAFYENLVDGQEYEVLYTLDETFAKLYVNGDLRQEKASTAFDISSIRPLFIGGYFYGDPTQLNASSLKNFKILSRVCTPEEVSPDFISDPSLLLQLNTSSISDKLWIDTSSNNNGASLAVEEKKPTLVFNPANDYNDFVPVEKKNLFSKENILHNKILDGASGHIADFNLDGMGLEISGVGFFNVEPNKWYFIRNGFKGGYIRATGYHENGNSLGLVPISDRRSFAVQAARRPGVEPYPVSRIYFQLYRFHKETDLPSFDDVAVYELDGEFDTNIPEEITAFGQEKEINESLIATERVLSPYEDAKILVFGDSITANEQWTIYLQEKLHIEKLFNRAIGGANIRGDENTDGSGPPEDPYSRRNLKPQIKYTPSRIYREIFEFGEILNGEQILKLDVVMISMGFNDAKNNWPLGDWEVIKNTPWTDLSAVDTVQGALKYNLNTLMNTVIKDTVTIDGVDYTVGIDCTEAKIIWQLPIQTAVSDSTENRLPDVIDAIRNVCEYYAIPTIDGYTKSGISREVELLYPEGKYLLDKIHPNKLGYRKLGELNTSGLIANFI